MQRRFYSEINMLLVEGPQAATEEIELGAEEMNDFD